MIERIKRKFSQIPNTGHMQIWLQRISFPFAPSIIYDEPLCQLVYPGAKELWNNDWITSKPLLKAIDPNKFVDSSALASLAPVIPTEEVELYTSAY